MHLRRLQPHSVWQSFFNLHRWRSSLWGSSPQRWLKNFLKWRSLSLESWSEWRNSKTMLLFILKKEMLLLRCFFNFVIPLTRYHLMTMCLSLTPNSSAMLRQWMIWTAGSSEESQLRLFWQSLQTRRGKSAKQLGRPPGIQGELNRDTWLVNCLTCLHNKESINVALSLPLQVRRLLLLPTSTHATTGPR